MPPEELELLEEEELELELEDELEELLDDEFDELDEELLDELELLLEELELLDELELPVPPPQAVSAAAINPKARTLPAPRERKLVLLLFMVSACRSTKRLQSTGRPRRFIPRSLLLYARWRVLYAYWRAD